MHVLVPYILCNHEGQKFALRKKKKQAEIFSSRAQGLKKKTVNITRLRITPWELASLFLQINSAVWVPQRVGQSKGQIRISISPV